MKHREEILAEGVRLILGDCLDVLPTIAPVDHIICDPPYEQLMQELHASGELRRNDFGNRRKELGFDSIEKIRRPFLESIKNLNQGWFLAFCNVEGVWHWREAITDAGLKFKTACAWIKPDATPKLNGQGPAVGYECITTTWMGRGHASWNGGGKRGVFVHCTNSAERQGEHPTEKPLSLMREIVTLFSNSDQLVCDPFMGSGTTGVACVRLGRRFIGVEKDPRWFDLACERIDAALKQPDLFIATAPRPKQYSWDEMWRKPIDQQKLASLK